MLKSIFRLFVLASFVGASSVASAQGLPPSKPAPVAVLKKGVWVPADPKAAATKGKSAATLELMEILNQGVVNLQLDVTQWGTLGARASLAQVIHELRFNQSADKIPLLAHSVTDWGLFHPKNAQEALDALIARVKVLEDQVYALQHP